MTTVKPFCPTCGEVELQSDKLKLEICSNYSQLSFYSFSCPRCLKTVRKPADDDTISLLVNDAGVHPTQWYMPAEALEPHQGMPISYDDVLDFALKIKHIGYVSAIAERSHGS